MEIGPELGDFVLVEFKTKSLNVFFVGKIIDDIRDTGEYHISIMRNSLNSNKTFFMPDNPDVAQLNISYMKMIRRKQF